MGRSRSLRSTFRGFRVIKADHVDAAVELADLHFDAVFRQEHGRGVATLISLLGDIDLVDEAAQEAFVIALQRWPDSGTPPNPGGWLTTTARNRAIDRIGRELPSR